MKKLILLLSLAVLVSCGSSVNPELVETTKVVTSSGNNITTFEFEGCEYVFYQAGYGGGLTHKGNCKYCENKLNTRL